MPINTILYEAHISVCYHGTFDRETCESDSETNAYFELQPYCDALLSAKDTGYGKVEYGNNKLEMSRNPHQTLSQEYNIEVSDGQHSQNIWGLQLEELVPRGITLEDLLQLHKSELVHK